MTTSPEMPTDTPLLRILRELEAEGKGGQFQSLPGGMVKCLTCGAQVDAKEIAADDVTRLEGVSDPDDMLMVVPARCPTCATQGALVLHYGPDSSPEDADVLVRLDRDDPQEGDAGRPTPGYGPAPS